MRFSNHGIRRDNSPVKANKTSDTTICSRFYLTCAAELYLFKNGRLIFPGESIRVTRIHAANIFQALFEQTGNGGNTY